MNEEAIILKRDAAGRVVVTEQQRVDLVRAYERSGLSGPKFAELAGVNYQTFASWRSQHGTQPPSRRRATPAATLKTNNLSDGYLDPFADNLSAGLATGGALLNIDRWIIESTLYSDGDNGATYYNKGTFTLTIKDEYDFTSPAHLWSHLDSAKAWADSIIWMASGVLSGFSMHKHPIEQSRQYTIDFNITVPKKK